MNPPLGVPKNVHDTEWTPNESVPGVFYLQGNVIFDVKRQDTLMPNTWAQIPPNATYFTMNQAMRLKYRDPCGVDQIIPLGSFAFRRVKDANGDWFVASP